MRFRCVLTVALLALGACESTTDPVAPYEQSADFELDVVGGHNSIGTIVMGDTTPVKFVVPEGLLGGEAHPVYGPIGTPFEMSIAEDTLFVTYPSVQPIDNDGSGIGTAGGGGGGAIGMYPQETASVLMAPANIHLPVLVQFGALRGEGEVRGVVGMETLALRPAEYGDAAGICLPAPVTVDGELLVHSVTILADARSIPQEGLPGGSYRVPVVPFWSVADSAVAPFADTWEDGGAQFARIEGHAPGETMLRVTAGARSDTIPVRVGDACPA